MFICEISKEPQKYKNPSTKHLYTPFLFTLNALISLFRSFQLIEEFCIFVRFL